MMFPVCVWCGFGACRCHTAPPAPQQPVPVTNQRHVSTGYNVPEGFVPTAWCGAAIDPLVWHFVDATHVLLALRGGTSSTPCTACLRAIQKILDVEIGAQRG